MSDQRTRELERELSEEAEGVLARVRVRAGVCPECLEPLSPVRPWSPTAGFAPPVLGCLSEAWIGPPSMATGLVFLAVPVYAERIDPQFVSRGRPFASLPLPCVERPGFVILDDPYASHDDQVARAAFAYWWQASSLARRHLGPGHELAEEGR